MKTSKEGLGEGLDLDGEVILAPEILREWSSSVSVKIKNSAKLPFDFGCQGPEGSIRIEFVTRSEIGQRRGQNARWGPYWSDGKILRKFLWGNKPWRPRHLVREFELQLDGSVLPGLPAQIANVLDHRRETRIDDEVIDDPPSVACWLLRRIEFPS